MQSPDGLVTCPVGGVTGAHQRVRRRWQMRLPDVVSRLRWGGPTDRLTRGAIRGVESAQLLGGRQHPDRLTWQLDTMPCPAPRVGPWGPGRWHGAWSDPVAGSRPATSVSAPHQRRGGDPPPPASPIGAEAVEQVRPGWGGRATPPQCPSADVGDRPRPGAKILRNVHREDRQPN